MSTVFELKGNTIFYAYLSIGNDFYFLNENFVFSFEVLFSGYYLKIKGKKLCKFLVLFSCN